MKNLLLNSTGFIRFPFGQFFPYTYYTRNPRRRLKAKRRCNDHTAFNVLHCLLMNGPRLTLAVRYEK